MNIINSSWLQTRNISNNSNERIDHQYFFFFVGICMAVENSISIIILCKCTRLLSQIKMLSLNMVISDILTGLVIILLTRILFEKYQCDVKKNPTFIYAYHRISFDHHHDEPRPLFHCCLCNAIFFVHH